MSSLFTKIINGEIPCYKIAETEKYIAFLDIFPVAKAHTLIIPKTETDKIFDVADDYLDDIMLFAKPIALAIEKVVPCNRVNMLTAGFEVPHAHIHLIASNSVDDLNLGNPKLSFSKEEFIAIQQQIIAALPK